MSKIEQVKELRLQTGLSLSAINEALKNSDGDVEKAKKWLRENLRVKITDVANATEGTIEIYRHHNGQVATMVAL